MSTKVGRYDGHMKARDLPAAWTRLPCVGGRHGVRLTKPPGTSTTVIHKSKEGSNDFRGKTCSWEEEARLPLAYVPSHLGR